MHRLIIFVIILLLAPFSRAGCGQDDAGGPYADELSAQRVYTFEPTSAVNPSSYEDNTLTVVQYNIQSGNSLSCTPDLSLQIQTIASQNPDFFAIQEVNVNVPSRCACNQPASFANGTGLHAAFYRTLFFESDSSLYGHASGSVYDINNIESHLFNDWTEERRGVLALVTYPPQFNNRPVLLVSNHFQYDDESTREGQAMEVIAFVEGLIKQYPDALILMPGDYYTEIGQTAYYMLLSYFNNSWNDFNGGSDLGGDTYPSNAPTNRFDHVWYKYPSDLTVQVQNVQILDTQNSDHRPLVVTFNFPDLASNPPASGGSSYPTYFPTLTPNSDPSSPTSAPTPTPNADPSSPTSAPTSAPASSGCKASASISKRASSAWVANGVEYDVFEINVQNTGSSEITSLSLTFPDMASATQSWNYPTNGASAGQVTIPPYFTAGSVFNGAGFILPSTYSISGQTLSVSCQPSSVGVSCASVSGISISTYMSTSWSTNGTLHEIIQLTITNNGQSTISDLIVSINTPGMIVSSMMWNMQQTSGNDYRISLFNPLTPGSSISSSGFQFDGSSTISVTPSSSSLCA